MRSRVETCCEFFEQGCHHKIAREDIDDHHVKFARKHANLVSKAIQDNREEINWREKCVNWEISRRSYVQPPEEGYQKRRVHKREF